MAKFAVMVMVMMAPIRLVGHRDIGHLRGKEEV
jgi:hypothetical protein